MRPTDPRAASTLETMRSAEFRPRRAIWPGVLVAAVIAAGIAALVVSQHDDYRTLGARLDAPGMANIEPAPQGRAEPTPTTPAAAPEAAPSAPTQ